MYSIDGVKRLDEIEFTHLDGYCGSKPVRVGNGAYDHLQLDIYGELMDGIYLYNKHGSPISYDMWCSVRKLTNYVCANWYQPDMSIWEVRGRKQHFTYSLVMCWVAIDRGIKNNITMVSSLTFSIFSTSLGREKSISLSRQK